MLMPDGWEIIVMMTRDEQGNPVLFGHRVLCSFAGGYLNGNAWRLSSSIKHVDYVGKGNFEVVTESGQTYLLNAEGEGRLLAIAENVKKQLEESATDAHWIETGTLAALHEKLNAEGA